MACAIVKVCFIFRSGNKLISPFEPFVSKEPEKLLEKCKEFQPTILVLTGEPENLPEFLKQIAPGCPDAAIIISSSKPELLPYSKSELEAAHVCAVLKKPFVREDFLGAIQNIKDNK